MWGFKKKREVVDLTDHCNRNRERLRNIESQMKAVEPNFRGSSEGVKRIAVINTSPNLLSSLTNSQNSSNAQSSQESSQTNAQTNDGGYAAPFPFFMDNSPSSSSTQNSFTSNSGSSISAYSSGEDAEEKRKRLANRLVQMTTQIEDLSNQMYQMQQRLEMIERKLGVGGSGY